MASEFESDLWDTVDWGKKGLIDFNAGNGHLNGLITVVLLMWKWMSLFLKKKHLLRCWGWPSLLAKTASKKIGALISSMKFVSSEVALYLCESTICPFMVYCCHVWTGAPRCYLDFLDKLQKQICKTVVPSLAASLEPLAHYRNVDSLNLLYRYYFSRCSSELAQLVPLLFSEERSTGYYDRLHDFSLMLQGCLCQQFLSSHS